MSQPQLSPLPIDAVLDVLCGALDAGLRAILVAPPGAGKTTRVPLALLGAAWMNTGTLDSARAAASRGKSGPPTGWRPPSESVSATRWACGRGSTRACRDGPGSRLSTEGVFTRMILDDPGLDGVAGVIFDEFHERSLDADLGLALALEAQGRLAR